MSSKRSMVQTLVKLSPTFPCFFTVLLISQMFALLPISNLWSKNESKLRYHWFSIPTAYAATVMILNIAEFSVVIYYLSFTGVNFHSLGKIISQNIDCNWKYFIHFVIYQVPSLYIWSVCWNIISFGVWLKNGHNYCNNGGKWRRFS